MTVSNVIESISVTSPTITLPSYETGAGTVNPGGLPTQVISVNDNPSGPYPNLSVIQLVGGKNPRNDTYSLLADGDTVPAGYTYVGSGTANGVEYHLFKN